MAAPDPRRSSRARAQSTSQQSSTTSSLSGRAERTTRSFNKSGSPQKGTPTGSLSSEPPDDTIEASDDHLLRPRRTRSNNEDNKTVAADESSMANGVTEIGEDDEAVRCICGHEDYPGPPSLEDLKRVAKDGIELEAVFPTEITEDLAGFFVQCDVCHVWQHGACVGLSNDDSLPEEYFCEECREDFHRTFKTAAGRRFSLYLPLERNSRAVSLVKEGTRSPNGKETRNSKALANYHSKRRSTMNSRDAAYDEEEQLRRAIEASKEDNSVDGTEVGTRRTKRGRSDSEEKPEGAIKRPRTSSRSPSPQPDKQLEAEESDDQSALRNGASKKSRSSVTVRSQRERSEKVEREKQRVEAANKRKGRAERRRADGIQPTILVKVSEAHQDTDSDPSEELPLAARAPTNPPTSAPAVEAPPPPEAPAPSHQDTPDTPPATAVPMATSKSRGGRPTHRKKGRNQYTKDRDEPNSPARSQSRDVQDTPTIAHTKGGAGEQSKPSRAKGGMNSRITMSELRRRATAMFDYISRTQLELAGETSPAQGHASPSEAKEDAGPSSNGAPAIVVNGGTASPQVSADAKGNGINGDSNKSNKEFRELSCVEMMDFLTRDLVHWQNQFAT